MALKNYRPITPSQRTLVLVSRAGLHSGGPEKTLCEGRPRTGGRNNNGRITVRHRGGGHKRTYRKIDFRRAKVNAPATVVRLEYDPFRTAFIALMRYEDGELAYFLAPQRVQPGDVLQSGPGAPIKEGNMLPLSEIPVGSLVHNIELKPGGGGKIARSAGNYAQLAGRDSGYALLRLSSGEQRRVLAHCSATIGSVSNSDHMNINLGKAGRSRWLGRKPTVRGVAMNPVDHPHGGGEGKSSGGRHPVTPWGVPTKGKRTRNNKATDKYIVRSRHRRKGGR